MTAEASFMCDGRVDTFALAAVLGGVVKNVQKHLTHTRHVARDLRNLLIAAVVVQADALLPQPVAVHEDRILKLRQNIGGFDMELKRPSCMRVNSSSSSTMPVRRLASRAMITTPRRVSASRFSDVRSVSPQPEMAVSGVRSSCDTEEMNSVCVFRLTNLDGHIIDGTDQLADLVVILAGDLHTVGAGGNALGRRVDLPHGHQNRLDKQAAQADTSQPPAGPAAPRTVLIISTCRSASLKLVT